MVLFKWEVDVERGEIESLVDEISNRVYNRVYERLLLVMPEVMGNRITQQIANSKINSAFYKAHPEFADKKEIVASVVESIEGKDPLRDYKDILNDAVPVVRERILTMKNLNMKVSDNPSRDFKSHGEL